MIENLSMSQIENSVNLEDEHSGVIDMRQEALQLLENVTFPDE